MLRSLIVTQLFRRRQRKLKEKLEHTKFNLKYVTDMADYYKNHCPGVTPGCKWGDWSPWGACIEGKRVRRRPRLVGEGSCDGEEMETEEGCVEVNIYIDINIILSN